MRWLASEWDYRDSHVSEDTFGRHRQVTEFMTEQSDAIGVGDPLSIPGTWPDAIRQLFQ